jgi:prepilin-type N-terminal cleavage/methylation domain-containing protein
VARRLHRSGGVRRDDGFTLTEVLVASLLVAGMAASLAALPTNARRVADQSRRATTVAIVAAAELDAIRAGPSPAAGLDYLDASGRSLGPAPSPLVVFVCRWSVEPAAFDPDRVSVVRIVASTIAAGRRRTSIDDPAEEDVRLTALVWGVGS